MSKRRHEIDPEAQLSIFTPFTADDAQAEAERLYDEQETINIDQVRYASWFPDGGYVTGEQLVAHMARLELLAEADTLRAGSEPYRTHNIKNRKRPPARTASQKAARDMGESLKYKTPPEWSPIVL